MHYLQKIVQLPFQIPVWSTADLSNTLKSMIETTGIPKLEIEKILNETTELIIYAAQPNPRDIKRFINSIILSRYIYEQSIKDIEKIVAVQAFYFRGGGWLKFLKLLFPYRNRIEFLKDFILLHEDESSERQGLTLEDLKKMKIENEDQEKKKISLDKPILEIYKKLVELDDEDLLSFLRASAPTLIKIDRIDKYLRVVEETSLANKRKSPSFAFEFEKQLELLKDKKITVEEFNQLIEQLSQAPDQLPPVHLPYEDFHSYELKGINLRQTFLFKADISNSDLSGANLSGSDLSGANLSGSDLSGANLSGANIVHANLMHAKLPEADLTDANLSHAKLSGADLTHADLTHADLTRTYLSGAYLSHANLSHANLSHVYLSGSDRARTYLTHANLTRADLTHANLTLADLSGAILVNNKYEQSINKDTYFSKAVIDNPKYIQYLKSNGGLAIPDEIRNKQDLKAILQEKELSEDTIYYIASMSDLPY